MIADLIAADAAARLKSTTDLSAAQKDASKKLLDGVLQVTRDSIASGNVNAFVETVPGPDGKLVPTAQYPSLMGQDLTRYCP